MNNKNDKDYNKNIEIPSFMDNSSRGRTLPKVKQILDDDLDSDAFIKEINSSLAKQINSDMDDKQKKGKTSPMKKKRKRIYKAPLIILTIILVLISALLFTDTGKQMIIDLAGNYIYGNLDYQASKNSGKTADMSKVDLNTAAFSDHVINILLIGEEQIGGAMNTDSMIVASMNTEDHSLKLTSIMRDLYVDIPGHDKSKLNSAYGKGGIDLLYQTIEQNFDLDLDGYCIVNFDSFEQIIDMLGGVEITLTEGEAHYLNTTNYISDKSNRHVVAGKQLMNGNQALGYCRVRKVSTGTENNDFGRTQRQRAVLTAIYNRLKSKNVIQLVYLLNKILKQVDIKTDITNQEFNNYLKEAVSLKVKELKTFRIPTDGSYGNQRVPMGRYMVEVLVPNDWNVTRLELHDFIYSSVGNSNNLTPTGINNSSTKQ